MNAMMTIKNKINTFYHLFKITGLWGVLTYKPVIQPVFKTLWKIGLLPKNIYVKLNLKGYKYPVWFRYGSSDMDVFYQIFVEQEYSGLNDLEDAKVIIDCGANVGYSSLYLLNKYTNAHVIAVEPDDENFKVCEKNLAPYSRRVSLIRSAIWSHQTGLRICKEGYRDSREWSIQVKECQEGQEPDIYATDISKLLEKSGFSNIDILKIDIEGSEVAVFSKNYENWLRKCRNIVIELHDEDCEKKFFNALSSYSYDVSIFGELTFCKKISPKGV